jgi:hypothetical protein
LCYIIIGGRIPIKKGSVMAKTSDQLREEERIGQQTKAEIDQQLLEQQRRAAIRIDTSDSETE